MATAVVSWVTAAAIAVLRVCHSLIEGDVTAFSAAVAIATCSFSAAVARATRYIPWSAACVAHSDPSALTAVSLAVFSAPMSFSSVPLAAVTTPESVLMASCVSFWSKIAVAWASSSLCVAWALAVPSTDACSSRANCSTSPL